MFDKSEIYSFENEYIISIGNEEIVLDQHEFDGFKKLLGDI